MSLRIEVGIKVSAEDPDDPENEEVAVDIVMNEAQEFAHRARERLDEAGLEVKEFSTTRGD